MFTWKWFLFMYEVNSRRPDTDPCGTPSGVQQGRLTLEFDQNLYCVNTLWCFKIKWQSHVSARNYKYFKCISFSVLVEIKILTRVWVIWQEIWHGTSKHKNKPQMNYYFSVKGVMCKIVDSWVSFLICYSSEQKYGDLGQTTQHNMNSNNKDFLDLHEEPLYKTDF